MSSMTIRRREALGGGALEIERTYNDLTEARERLRTAGANALVLFNRFYQPDFDLDNYSVTPNLVLSDSNELRLRLRWRSRARPGGAPRGDGAVRAH